jgi:hypothetical protein
VLRLPPQVPFLAGREELLAELDDQLAEREGAGPRVLGAEHPDTLAARSGLADWTGEGDAARGRDQFAALLPIRERVSGPDHPETLGPRGQVRPEPGIAAGTA